jgi:hypothetical protein
MYLLVLTDEHLTELVLTAYQANVKKMVAYAELYQSN